VSNEATEDPNAPNWFYNNNKNEKHGPVSETQLVNMLNAEVITPETFVWCQGMEKWLPANQTKLIAQAVTAPPRPSGDMITNKWVWVMALWPLLNATVYLSLEQNEMNACVKAMSMVAGICDGVVDANAGVRNLKVMGFNIIFGSFFVIKDWQNLYKLGYKNWWMLPLGIVLDPVYLFVRAHKVKQRPWYGLTWVAITVLLAILS